MAATGSFVEGSFGRSPKDRPTVSFQPLFRLRKFVRLTFARNGKLDSESGIVRDRPPGQASGYCLHLGLLRAG